MNVPRISLAMIVRDEQDYLGAALTSMAGAVDEICVVDTGSTDATMDIAKAFGAKTGFFAWNDRFDDARNAAIDLATGDWIVSLDADERLVSNHWQLIRKVSVEAPPDCHAIFFTCLSGTPGPVDESPVLRMFRRLPHVRYEGRAHEEVGMTIQRAGAKMGMSQVCIVHDGYQRELVAAKGKWARNERLLLLENAERPGSGFTLYNLGHLYMVKGEPATAAPYFARALELANPGNLFWGRLVEEARMANLTVMPRWQPAWPLDPVALGAHPDPLARVA